MGEQAAPLTPRMPGKPRVSKQMVLTGSPAFCATEQTPPQCQTPSARGLPGRLLGAEMLGRRRHGFDGQSGSWGAAWRGPHGSHPMWVPLITFPLPPTPPPGVLQSSGSPTLTWIRITRMFVSADGPASRPGCLLQCLRAGPENPHFAQFPGDAASPKSTL